MPVMIVSQASLRRKTRTNKIHDFSNRPFDGDAIDTVDRNETSLTADGRKSDKGRIVGHDFGDFLEAIRENPVDLARENCRISREHAAALQHLPSQHSDLEAKREERLTV